jgi:bifunctional non-homologous end joining protein LigD
MKELSKGDRVWQSKPSSKSSRLTKRISSRRPSTAPIPAFVEPMKAKLVDSMPSGDWIYEIKFDGFRALALRGGSEARLLSRNEKDLGGKFTEVMDSISELDVRDAIIDGEIVALDNRGHSSFQLLQSFEMGEERPPIFYYAFDLLRLNGKDLQNLPVEQRKAKLEQLLKDAPGVIRYSASIENAGEDLLERARELGVEGLIGKRVGSRYEPGKRTGAWIKLKLQQEQEFVIGGYTEPEGTRKYFGALLVGVYESEDLRFAGKVGTGFNENLLRTLFSKFEKIPSARCPFVDLPEKRSGRYGRAMTASEMKRCHWVEPTLVCQIKFAEWTRDNRLRQPVFLGLREDKDAKEVVREKAT